MARILSVCLYAMFLAGCTSDKSTNASDPQPTDCMDVAGGEATVDECGVCNGDGSSCLDCAGIPNGDAVEDHCGTCDSNSDNDCLQDCNGEWGGTATEDRCGVCDGDGSTCRDCSIDSCADLSVSSLTYASETHQLEVQVTNRGDIDAVDVVVGFLFNEEPDVLCELEFFAATTTLDTLAAGASVTFTSTEALGVSVLEYLAEPGDHRGTVIIDAPCAVLEDDESNNRSTVDFSIQDPTQYTYQGLHGYIGSYSSFTPDAFRYGASFYSSVWSLVAEPVANFQIGLPGTWFTPNNGDNTTEPLCPVGTVARDNWPERGPTYQDVFQTMEGGLGYWVGNRFHYGPPKYSMNATPDCYNNQIASPGWPFFGSSAPLNDNLLGIAQVSNRMIIPPDGLPFEGEPRGELVGYGYIALPLTDARSDPQPTGNQSWTLFLNSANFKGPLAYYLPETWSRISRDYPFDHGRGLDARPIRDGLAGSMEINTVPQFQAQAADGVMYSKIPQLQFPVDSQNRTDLVRDVTFYSKEALFDAVAVWRGGGTAPSGMIPFSSQYRPSVSTSPVTYRQNDKVITGINEAASPTVFDGNVFGLQWSRPGEDGFAKFPQYFRHEGSSVVAISAEEVPVETLLHRKRFNEPSSSQSAYSAESLDGAWEIPGPVLNTYDALLGDCSRVTYQWYRFIDQPVFQQYNWSEEEKTSLQDIVEKIHTHWSIDETYLADPSEGTLASFDSALLVTPPEGLEVGYVPIVIRQEQRRDGECASPQQAAVNALSADDLVGRYERRPVDNGWHSVEIILENSQLRWRNDAGVEWSLNFENGVLETGDDCPYGVSAIEISLSQDNNGDYTGRVTGLNFNNELYESVSP